MERNEDFFKEMEKNQKIELEAAESDCLPFKQSEKKEIIEDFFEAVDMAGLFMPFNLLEKFIFFAPVVVRETEDFHYLVGLYDGRMIHECLGGI